jgi:predicted transcriptional regulator YdeE
MNPQPTFLHKDAFKIVGVERYTENGIPSIQEAWSEFTKRSEEIKRISTPRVCYGFEDYSRDFVMNSPGFPKYYYLAAWEVDKIADVPEGMKSKEVPAADYAMFTHRGSISALPKVFAYIYGEWMPASGYAMDPKVQADFERYTEKMTDMENAVVEIWVPVVKKE